MASLQGNEQTPKGLSEEFWQIPYNRYLYKQCKDLKIVLRDINKKLSCREEPDTFIIVDDDDDDNQDDNKEEKEEEMVISDDEDVIQLLVPASIGGRKDDTDDVQYRLDVSRNGAQLAQTTINVANITKYIYTKNNSHINIELRYPDFTDCFAIDSSGQLQSYEQQYDIDIDRSSAEVLDLGRIEVCCWYRREGYLKELLTGGIINDQSFKFMRTRHQCRLDKCLCCQECKEKVSKSVDATSTKNTVKLEHMISILYNRRPVPASRKKSKTDIMYKVKQKYCNNVNVTHDITAPQSAPEGFKRKSFKNAILIISKILPNDAKDIEIYIIGKTMTDVSCHLFLNHKNKLVSPLSSLSKTHNLTRSKLYEYNICCWYEREQLIKRLSKISEAPIEELNFLRKKHFCSFKPSCDCCCKNDQKENEPAADSEEIPNVDNNSITEDALVEDEIKIEIQEQLSLPLDPLQTESTIKEETESIALTNVYSPKTLPGLTNTYFETNKGDRNIPIPEPPNQIPIPEPPNQVPIAQPPKLQINPTIQIKSCFLKAILDSKRPLKIPLNEKNQSQVPIKRNKIATSIKKPILNDDSLAKADLPGPPPKSDEITATTLANRKRKVSLITLEVIELRLKTFRSELLKLASLTNPHVKKVISDGFQNMLDNIKPNNIVEPVNCVPDSVEETPVIVKKATEFAKDIPKPLEDKSINERLCNKPGLSVKAFANRNNKTISIKKSKIRKRKRPFRTEQIDEINYSTYCDKLTNFYKKLHL